MSSTHINVCHPPFVDGSNCDYWKTCIRIHLKELGGNLWKIVDEGYVVLNSANPTQIDNDNLLGDAQAMNVLIRALCIDECHRVCKLETAHEIWLMLMESHESTSTIKSAKLFICKGKFKKSALLYNEDLNTTFSQLNNIVNELNDLCFDVPNADVSYKFLRALSPKYEAIVKLLVRSNLKDTSILEILGEILTHDIFKQ
jgi:hypothetical protein